MVSTFTDLILRVVLAIVLAKQFHDVIGVWLAWPIGWVIAVIISFAFYKAGKWDKTPEERASKSKTKKRRKSA